MQAGELLSFSSASASAYTSSSTLHAQDSAANMNLHVSANADQSGTEPDDLESSAFHEKLQLHDVQEEDEDFSFVCANPDASPITADDAFYNGQIRPMFPLFNRQLLFVDDNHGDSETEGPPSLRPPLRKVFVERLDSLTSSSSELEGVLEGTYCEWSPATVESSPELGKKSNSTGFSKLWRFRDLMHRSSSDGKDAFVFLNNPTTPKSSKNKAEKMVTETRSSGTGKVKPVKAETVPSAHERHYIRSRAKKEVDKRRSYLPYRQDLVGFFTSVNGLSKNVHPF